MKNLMIGMVLLNTIMGEVLFAQQDPQFTQFMHSKLIYNPGYAGTSESLCFNTVYRKQYVNFPGAPTTGLFSFDMPIRRNIGIGLNVMKDEIGPLKTTYARLAVSFIQPLRVGKIGIGLDGGLQQLAISNNWIVPEPGKEDQYIPGMYQSGVNIINNPNLNKSTYDFNFGAYYTIPNTFYVGLSTTHLTAQNISTSKNIYFSMARHYYLMAGYSRFLNNPRDNISANLKIKTDAATTQVDVNVTYTNDNLWWTGVSFRRQDAIAPMIGCKFFNRSLKVGYSYDITLSKMRGYSNGTHEIMLSYCIPMSKIICHLDSTAYDNVRFLNGVRNNEVK